MGFLTGKNLLITGLLNKRSIAFGVAKAARREDAALAKAAVRYLSATPQPSCFPTSLAALPARSCTSTPASAASWPAWPLPETSHPSFPSSRGSVSIG